MPSPAFYKRYYYNYLDSLVSFLVPTEARTLRVSKDDVDQKRCFVFPDKKYDYIVLTDAFGYLYDIQAVLEDA